MYAEADKISSSYCLMLCHPTSNFIRHLFKTIFNINPYFFLHDSKIVLTTNAGRRDISAIPFCYG